MNYFKIVWTEDYRKLQNEFFQAVQTHDPNSFNYLLAKNAYHVDSLLQLSEVLKKFGEFDSAKDFIDRSVYCFECSWHSLFNPFLGNCRLEYSIEENKYRTLFFFLDENLWCLNFFFLFNKDHVFGVISRNSDVGKRRMFTNSIRILQIAVESGSLRSTFCSLYDRLLLYSVRTV